MSSTRHVIRWRRMPALMCVLGLSAALAVSSVPAATAAIRTGFAPGRDMAVSPPDPGRHAAATASNCDPDDLPGGSEGPDNDGDECGFTIAGSLGPSQPPADPQVLADSEFAGGSPQLAATCRRSTFVVDEGIGIAVAAEFINVGAPYASAFLINFLDGTGDSIDEPDTSALALEAKLSSVFRDDDQQFQQYAKHLLDQNQQTLTADISKGLKTIDFSQSIIPDLRLGFGGTQGLQVKGSGYEENGRYVGTITYTIQDVYGFYARDKFLGVGPKMHYLQGVCGAPFYRGGAQWYRDSVAVTVDFNQPIG